MKKYRVIALILSLTFVTPIYNQNTESIIADIETLYVEKDTLPPSEYESTKQKLNNYISELQVSNRTHQALGKAHYIMAQIDYNLRNRNAAANGYEKVIDFQKSINMDTTEVAYAAYFMRIRVLETLGEYKKAIELSIEYIRILNNQSQPNYRRIVKAHEKMAWIHSRMGEYEDAIKIATTGLNIHSENLPPDDDSKNIILRTLAEIYKQLGQFGKSIEYAEQYLIFYQDKNLEQYGNEIFSANEMLSTIHGQKRDYHKSLEYSYKCLDYAEKNFGRKHNSTAATHYNIGYTHYSLKNLNKAIKHLSTSQSIAIEILGKTHPIVAEIETVLAHIHFDKKEYTKAQNKFQKALDIRKLAYGEKHKTIAHTYYYIGQSHLAQEEYTNAIDAYQIGINAVCSNFNNLHFNGNPDIDNESFIHIELIALLSAKHRALNKLNEDDSHHDIALKTLNTAFSAYLVLRKQNSRSKTKQEELSKIFPVFEDGVAFFSTHHIGDKSQKEKQQAFKYSEGYKSVELIEKINEENIAYNTNFDKKINIEESILQDSISKLQKSIFQENQSIRPDSSKIDKYKTHLFELNTKYDDFVIKLKNNHPQYFNLKYQNETIPAKTVQTDLLVPTQALIEYFTGDSAIYAFIITPTEYEIIEIKKDFPLNELVAQLQRNTYTCQLKGNCTDTEYKVEADSFALIAHELYERIFSPIEKTIDLPKEIIIIPDGVLGYIPFEMLLRERPDNSMSFSTHPYLLKDYQISYCYSATLLHEMKKMEKGKAEKNFLAFAPSFGDGKEMASTNRSIEAIRGSLGALIHNVPEVLALQKIMGGDIFTGDEATEGAFTESAPNYRILHLATHGKANDEIGDYAYLAFTEIPDSTENELLYNRDLYNLQLNADLVVLSACETGIGELQRGEGIISLARGFSYAGARSIVTTLWSINDQTTTELMKNFYSYLKDGMPKDAALRQAKLDYLNSHPNEEAHPFYWAAFVPIGDMTPIDLGGSEWWMWILGGTILWVGVYFSRKKTST